ncbi:MAG TPA: hypothetical protein VII26_01955 [Candidatus Limnocylindria bacterium]
MSERTARTSTEQTISYELVRTESGEAVVVGSATFRDGRFVVDAPEAVSVAVSELLARAFVDRVQADERARGYRRSGRGEVGMLVPGMPEHFIARLRGLWLPYPDGAVITARSAAAPTSVRRSPPTDLAESGAPVTDPEVRRASLAESGATVNAGPLVRSNEPATGIRPTTPSVARTDCGWII